MPTPGDWATWSQDALIIVTAVFAFLAFRKQSSQLDEDKSNNAKQMSLLRTQVNNEQEASQRQIALLSQQVEDQESTNARQREILKLQAEDLQAALEERRREALERRMAQASMVFLEVDHYDLGASVDAPEVMGESYSARITNTSKQPIYDVILKWHKGTAEWFNGGVSIEKLDRLMPDRSMTWSRSHYDGGNLSVIGAVVEFRDAAGVSWRQTNDGRLEELGETPSA